MIGLQGGRCVAKIRFLDIGVRIALGNVATYRVEPVARKVSLTFTEPLAPDTAKMFAHFKLSRVSEDMTSASLSFMEMHVDIWIPEPITCRWCGIPVEPLEPGAHVLADATAYADLEPRWVIVQCPEEPTE